MGQGFGGDEIGTIRIGDRQVRYAFVAHRCIRLSSWYAVYGAYADNFTEGRCDMGQQELPEEQAMRLVAGLIVLRSSKRGRMCGAGANTQVAAFFPFPC